MYIYSYYYINIHIWIEFVNLYNKNKFDRYNIPNTNSNSPDINERQGQLCIKLIQFIQIMV